MADTQQILDAVPTGVPLSTAAVAAAIDACLRCIQTCTTCANADLAEEDVNELRVCAALCITCADVCDVTARVLSRPAHRDKFIIHRLLQACVRACQSSTEECARHAHHHHHCAICEKVCSACTQACVALLDTQAMDETQDVAGAWLTPAWCDPGARLHLEETDDHRLPILGPTDGRYRPVKCRVPRRRGWR
jgi:hypothetical protein